MPVKVWNGSSWTTATRVRVWNGSTWVEPLYGKVWNGSAWSIFYAGLAAQLSTASYARTIFSPGSLQFNTNGYVYGSSNTNQLVQDYQWLTGAGISSDYEIYASVTAGVIPSGSSTGVWLSMASNVQWDVAAPNGQYKFSTLDVQIRMAASPNTVLAGPVSITVECDRT